MLDNCVDGGVRVDSITEKVNLSRLAVSRHLKDENIVSCQCVGTQNYYHIIGVHEILSLKKLLNDIGLFVKERNEKTKNLIVPTLLVIHIDICWFIGYWLVNNLQNLLK